LVVIVFVQFVETHGPLDVRWSGITPKDQGHRFDAPELGERDRLGATAVGEGEIGGQITGLGRLAVEFLLDRHNPPAVLDDEFGIVDQF